MAHTTFTMSVIEKQPFSRSTSRYTHSFRQDQRDALPRVVVVCRTVLQRYKARQGHTA